MSKHFLSMVTFVGIDLGTSGCRGVAISRDGLLRAKSEINFHRQKPRCDISEQDPHSWWKTIKLTIAELLRNLPDRHIDAIAIDGTSGTVVLCDEHGEPCSQGLMYDDARALDQAERIERVAPTISGAHGATSGLAKLLWLWEHDSTHRAHATSQAGFVTNRLLGKFGPIDVNNALKMGWDPVNWLWPAWIEDIGLPRSVLPDVVNTGIPIGHLSPDLCSYFLMSGTPLIVSGTTDSTAAVIASGASEIGDAVTSLGSTLVTKLITRTPIFAPQYGVYSQPFGNYWLAGGASNSGGRVLRHYFDEETMAKMERYLRPKRPTGLRYYPLILVGERFPHNDPGLEPRLSPRPTNDVEFFQGMLEGISCIELEAYQLLEKLGASCPRSIRTVGAGARNLAWKKIRSRILGIPLLDPEDEDAAFGGARLARQGFELLGTISPNERLDKSRSNMP